jgi:hypothetical protein
MKSPQPKRTVFRHWVHEMWIANCDERTAFATPKLTEQQYCAEYRWWFRSAWRQHCAS